MSSISGFPKFCVWENKLGEETAKLPEENKEIELDGYKGTTKVIKTQKVESYFRSRLVTKKHAERAQWKPFNVDLSTEDAIRQNFHVATLQRDQIWHPYYELKLDEEDFKDKMVKAKAQKDLSSLNKEVAELEDQIKQMEEQKLLEMGGQAK